MSEQANTQIVQGIYAAFAKGDVETILNALADKFDWYQHGPVEVIPWAKERHTKAEVAEFFSTLNQVITFEQFEPRQFVAQGDTVVAPGWWRGRGNLTGRVVEEYWSMEWKVVDGKVTYYRAYDDTAAIAAALKKD
jgi:uncharacterized protein